MKTTDDPTTTSKPNTANGGGVHPCRSYFIFPGVTYYSIMHAAADVFKVSVEQILSRSRKAEIVDARRVCMVWERHYTDKTLSEIGNKYGGRHHATVIYALKRHQDLYDVDKIYKERADEVFEKMNNSLIHGQS